MCLLLTLACKLTYKEVRYVRGRTRLPGSGVRAVAVMLILLLACLQHPALICTSDQSVRMFGVARPCTPSDWLAAALHAVSCCIRKHTGCACICSKHAQARQSMCAPAHTPTNAAAGCKHQLTSDTQVIDSLTGLCIVKSRRTIDGANAAARSAKVYTDVDVVPHPAARPHRSR